MAQDGVITLPKRVDPPRSTKIPQPVTRRNVQRVEGAQDQRRPQQFDASGIGSDGAGLQDVGNAVTSFAVDMANAEARERAQSEAITKDRVKADASRDMVDEMGKVNLLDPDAVGEAGGTLANIAGKYLKENQGSDAFNGQLENEMAFLLDTHIGALSTNSTTERRKVLDVQFAQDAAVTSNATVDITTKQTTGEPDIITRARALNSLATKYAPMYGEADTTVKIFEAQGAMLRAEFSRLLRNPTGRNIAAANAILDSGFAQTTLDPAQYDLIAKAFLDTTKAQEAKSTTPKSAMEIEFALIESNFPKDEQLAMKRAALGKATITDQDKAVKLIQNSDHTDEEKEVLIDEILTGHVRTPTEGDKLTSLITTFKLLGFGVDQDLATRLAGATPKELSEVEKRLKGIEKYIKNPKRRLMAIEKLLTNNANLDTPSEEGENKGTSRLAEYKRIFPPAERTPENKEAFFNADSPAGTTVNIAGKPSKLQETVGVDVGKNMTTLVEKAEVAESTNIQLDAVDDVLQDGTFIPGGFGEGRLYFSRMAQFLEDVTGVGLPKDLKEALGDASKGDQLKTAQNRLSLELAKGIGRILKMSLSMAKESVPGLLKSKEGNEIVVALMRAEAQRDIDLGLIAQKYQEIALMADPGSNRKALRDSNGVSYFDAKRIYKEQHPFMTDELKAKIKAVNKTLPTGNKIDLKSLSKANYNPKPPKAEPGAVYTHTDEEGFDYYKRPDKAVGGKNSAGVTKGKSFRMKPLHPAESPHISPPPAEDVVPPEVAQPAQPAQPVQQVQPAPTIGENVDNFISQNLTQTP
jgi:hypothetical protein